MLRYALHEAGALPSEATLRSAYRMVAALEGLAAWTSFDADEAFLRLSVGIDRELAAALGRLIVRCAHEFTLQAAH
jgi:hypothetical protein